MADKKTDNPRQIVLDDGRELTVDLRGLTWVEADEMAHTYVDTRAGKAGDMQAAQHRLAELLGKVVGLTADEMLTLSLVDFEKVSHRVWAFIRDPLRADPN